MKLYSRESFIEMIQSLPGVFCLCGPELRDDKCIMDFTGNPGKRVSVDVTNTDIDANDANVILINLGHRDKIRILRNLN